MHKKQIQMKFIWNKCEKIQFGIQHKHRYKKIEINVKKFNLGFTSVPEYLRPNSIDNIWIHRPCHHADHIYPCHHEDHNYEDHNYDHHDQHHDHHLIMTTCYWIRRDHLLQCAKFAMFCLTTKIIHQHLTVRNMRELQFVDFIKTIPFHSFSES